MQPGTPHGAVTKSVQVAKIAMPKPLPNAGAGFAATRLNTASICGWSRKKLTDPIRWKTPKKIFVNSMSDLFHEGIPDDYIENVSRVMLAANWHTFQVLTKLPDRMAALLKGKRKRRRGPGTSCGESAWRTASTESHGLPLSAKPGQPTRSCPSNPFWRIWVRLIWPESRG